MAMANEKFYNNRGSLTPRREPSLPVQVKTRTKYVDGKKDGIYLSLENAEPVTSAGYRYTELFVSLSQVETFALITELLTRIDPR